MREDESQEEKPLAKYLKLSEIVEIFEVKTLLVERTPSRGMRSSESFNS